MDLASAADELYGLPLGEFVAARTRLEKAARAAGYRELASDIHALHKPAQAAWALNQLVRKDAALLDAVLGLGGDLRDAQAAGDGAALRRLTARRHDLYATVRHRAEELVVADGRRLGAPVAAALERTVGAALADPRAADVVRSGRLVVDLENDGWGPVDLGGAQGGPSDVPRTGGGAASGDRAGRANRGQDPTEQQQTDARSERTAGRRAAERALVRCEKAEVRAREALDHAEEELHAAEAEHRYAEERAVEVRAELRRLEATAERAATHGQAAREARDRAARERELAARATRRARDEAERLTS